MEIYTKGWRNGSWGYHGDDGNCFHKHGNKTFGQLSTFGNDDEEETVGCGLIRRGRDLVLFFISPKAEHESIKLLNRNGAAPELFPVVGVDSHRVFSVNFGWEKPFKHSYVGLFRKKREIVSMVSIREHRRSEMTQFIIPTVIQLNSPYGNDGYSSSDGFDSSGTSISSADEDMSSFSESTSYPNSSSSMSISDDEEGYDDGVEASWSSRKVSRNTIKSNST